MPQHHGADRHRRVVYLSNAAVVVGVATAMLIADGSVLGAARSPVFLLPAFLAVAAWAAGTRRRRADTGGD